jgi:hypothetical protein
MGKRPLTSLFATGGVGSSNTARRGDALDEPRCQPPKSTATDHFPIFRQALTREWTPIGANAEGNRGWEAGQARLGIGLVWLARRWARRKPDSGLRKFSCGEFEASVGGEPNFQQGPFQGRSCVERACCPLDGRKVAQGGCFRKWNLCFCAKAVEGLRTAGSSPVGNLDWDRV